MSEKLSRRNFLIGAGSHAAAAAAYPRSVNAEQLDRTLERQEVEVLMKVFNMSEHEVLELQSKYNLEIKVNMGVEANYVVHIGQTHIGDERETNMYRSDILKSQTGVYNFLLEMFKRKTLDKVYDEGKVKGHNEEFAELFRDKVLMDIFFHQDILSKFGLPSENSNSLLDTLSEFIASFKNIETYHFLGEKVFDVLNLMLRQGQINNMDENLRLRLVGMLSNMNEMVKTRGLPNRLIFGGAVSMSMETGVPIFPADSAGLMSSIASLSRVISNLTNEIDRVNTENDKHPSMIEAHKLYRAMRTLLAKLAEANNEFSSQDILEVLSKEIGEVVRQAESLRPVIGQLLDKVNVLYRERARINKLLDRQIHLDREEFLIAQLPFNQNSFVVFGISHDFTSSVRRRNNSGPVNIGEFEQVSLGLIKITPK